MMPSLQILVGDALQKLLVLPSKSVQCCITSPPYWGLRDYDHPAQLGAENTPGEYVYNLVAVFREVRRVLRDDGTVWLNLGDSYYNYRPGAGQALSKQTLAKTDQDLPRACGRRGRVQEGLKEKDLCGIPWRVAFTLQADGWYLRNDIIWNKPNPMPESTEDRCTKSHEYIFLLSKKEQYYFDAAAIREKGVIPEGTLGAKGSEERFNMPGVNSRPPEYKVYDGFRNKRTVWTMNTATYPGAHFATFPEELPKLCILAGTKIDDTILDPFAGSGTTGAVAIELGRNAILIELNPEYLELINQRCDVTPGLPLFA